MGIHGLTSFMTNNSKLGVDHFWNLNNSKKNNDHLIFDGNAFVFYYAFKFRKHWTHGGQYNDFAKIISLLINKLQNFGFQLIFLFDGALPEAKENTRLKRYKGYIEKLSAVLNNLSQIDTSNKQNPSAAINNGPQYNRDLYIIPPLTIEVCIQTLRELDVTVMISSEEADGLVVQLAQEKNGYIISLDSDMYIYPHSGKGYIPLDSLKIPTINSNHTNTITAKIYQPEKLANFLQLDKSILPLFGSLLGNDYVNIQDIKHPIMNWCSTNSGFQVKKQGAAQWPKYVAEFLRCINQQSIRSHPSLSIIDTVVSHLRPIILNNGIANKKEFAENLGNLLVESVYRYDPQSLLLKHSAYSSTITSTPSTTSFYNNCELANMQRSRQILDVITTHTFWTGIYIEDIHLDSSWNISESLRQAMYGLLNVEIVKEYIREKGHMTVKEVPSTKMALITSNLNEENDLITAHKHLLIKLHHGPSNIQKFENQVPTPLQPLVLCLRYFIQASFNNNQPLANHEVVAILVASMVNLLPETLPSEFGINDAPTALIDPSTDSFKENQKFLAIPSLKIRSIHLISQWQHIILSSHYLAQTLLTTSSLSPTIKRNQQNQETVNIHFMQSGVLTNVVNGIILHTCLQLGRLGASMGKMMLGASTEWTQLFEALYNQVIADEYDQKVEKIFDYEFTNKLTKEGEQMPWMKNSILKKIDNKTKKNIPPSSVNKIKNSRHSSRYNSTNKNRSVINAFNVLSLDDE
ncbi:hypothetical protein BJ944DRAFT_286400 [Cunninghamella echinulata]|nr:hypothetical protein BJ944DRAFT_286400 [Cunninghamella echinulata]